MIQEYNFFDGNRIEFDDTGSVKVLRKEAGGII